jgi:hypothetical protein
VSMTGNIDWVEVITSVQRRRRWSAEEKAPSLGCEGLEIWPFAAPAVLSPSGPQYGFDAANEGRHPD